MAKAGAIQPGSCEFRIGTAGSTSLVLQTIPPVLMVADRPSTLLMEGAPTTRMSESICLPPYSSFPASSGAIVQAKTPQTKSGPPLTGSGGAFVGDELSCYNFGALEAGIG